MCTKYLNKDIRQPTENRTQYLTNTNHRLNITPLRVVNYVYSKAESENFKDEMSCYVCVRPKI